MPHPLRRRHDGHVDALAHDLGNLTRRLDIPQLATHDARSHGDDLGFEGTLLVVVVVIVAATVVLLDDDKVDDENDGNNSNDSH